MAIIMASFNNKFSTSVKYNLIITLNPELENTYITTLGYFHSLIISPCL